MTNMASDVNPILMDSSPVDFLLRRTIGINSNMKRENCSIREIMMTIHTDVDSAALIEKAIRNEILLI